MMPLATVPQAKRDEKKLRPPAGALNILHIAAASVQKAEAAASVLLVAHTMASLDWQAVAPVASLA